MAAVVISRSCQRPRWRTADQREPDAEADGDQRGPGHQRDRDRQRLEEHLAQAPAACRSTRCRRSGCSSSGARTARAADRRGRTSRSPARGSRSCRAPPRRGSTEGSTFGTVQNRTKAMIDATQAVIEGGREPACRESDHGSRTRPRWRAPRGSSARLQPLGETAERQHDRNQGDAGREQQVRRQDGVVQPGRDQHAERGLGRADTRSEKRQRGLEHDRVHEQERREHEDRRPEVREQLRDHHGHRPHPVRSRGLDEGSTAERHHLSAQRARHVRARRRGRSRTAGSASTPTRS